MRGNDVEREWIRGVAAFREEGRSARTPAGREGAPSELGRLLFRDRQGETVFCLAMLFALVGFAVAGPSSDPLLRLAGKALPGIVPRGLFRGCCGCTNDTAAIATLRNLASCQAQVQSGSRIDVDGDGIGEYGTFAELTGTAGVRTSADASTRGARMSPPVLSPALANVDANGIVTKSGYCFRIHLPVKGGAAGHEKRPADPFTSAVDTDRAEVRWCAYAWPVAKGNSGTRAFYVDETGNVYQCANDRAGYSGLTRGPAFDAAFAPGGKPGWGAPIAGATGSDGEVWKATN